MKVQQTKKSDEIKVSKQIHILIVDDAKDILDALNDILEMEFEELTIHLASNVNQAISLTQQYKPDIALLDIKLGQDNGLDLIPELKSIHANIACIMMTAYRDNEFTVAAVRLGASDYLYKPVKPSDLIQTISRVLEHQKIKYEIVKAERRFHTIFEQAAQWLFVINSDGQLIDANKSALEFMNINKNKMAGKFLYDTPWFLSSLDSVVVLKEGLSSISNGMIFSAEFNVLDEDKKYHFFEIYMNPIIDDENNYDQIVVECRNITDRKKAEDEILTLNSTLELRVKNRTIELEQSLLLLTEENKERKKAEDLFRKAKEEAEQASAAKSDFMSRMSHELRTPMNAILGFGQLLDMTSNNLNDDQHENIKEILRAGDHLLFLINQVLDLTGIESGELEVALEKTNLDDVLKQCSNLFSSQFEERQLTQIDNISGKDYFILGDFSRIKQIIYNLLSNAVKYNSDNGTVTLDAKIMNENRLRICITDTGEGLSDEDIANLFTPFDRLNSTFNVEGMGIGLVISKSLVELMGGSIGVESTHGEGSTFWFELELADIE